MAEFVISTESETLRVRADTWVLDGYDWFDFYRSDPQGDVLVLTVRAGIVHNIRRFEEPTPAE